MIRKRFRLTLASLGAAAATLVAAATIVASHSVAAPAAAAASGPTAAQLLARTSSCTPASNGAYATDDGGPATVSICRSGSAYFWTSDMDIDCDGITTSHCNASTDPWYQAQ